MILTSIISKNFAQVVIVYLALVLVCKVQSDIEEQIVITFRNAQPMECIQLRRIDSKMILMKEAQSC